MPVTIEQFVRDLVRSQVLSEEELATVRSDVRAKRLPRDPESLARELTRRGTLTKFQAAAVYQGRVDELVFGNYVVIDKIGAGRMGFVYQAKRRDLPGAFALKVLPARRLEESATARQRFEREIQLHVRLSHPNIVRIHDAGEKDGIPYLVMELVRGQDFNTLVKSQPLSVEQTVDYVAQVACGLAYAHGEGVVHRDIKPANLLLDVSGVVKILDMGLARLDDAEGNQSGARLTLQMQLLGTPHYMAPEQATDPRNADARADVYSLGCTWFYLLTGHAPYPRESKIDALIAHREEPIPSLTAARSDVPAALDAIFQKMLAKRLEDRYQSMAEVAAALEAWQQERAAASQPARMPPARLPPDSLPPSATETVANASTVEGADPAGIMTRAEIVEPRASVVPPVGTAPPPLPQDSPSPSQMVPPWLRTPRAILAIVIAAAAVALIAALAAWWR